MTTDTRPPARTVTLVVKEAAIVQDRRGTDQWKLRAEVPWSQYPETMYLDYDIPGSIPKGGYTCELRPRALKKNQDGTEKDPSQEYNWWWEIVKWDTANGKSGSGLVKDTVEGATSAPSQPQAAAPPSAPAWEDTPMKPDHPTKIDNIRRAVALEHAVTYHASRPASTAGEVMGTAATFYSEWLCASDVQSKAPERPQEADSGSDRHQEAPEDAQGGFDNLPPATVDPLPIPAKVTEEDFNEVMRGLGRQRSEVRDLLALDPELDFTSAMRKWFGDNPTLAYGDTLRLCLDAWGVPYTEEE
jgi:hypothetical protein